MFDFLFKRKISAEAPPAPAASSRPGVRHSRIAKRSLFAAAQSDRLNGTKSATPVNIDLVIERNQVALVGRSREQAQNNDYARSFLRMCRQNIVGPQGIMLTAKNTTASGKLDRSLNEAIEWSFAEWMKPQNCDVTGKRSFRSIQNSCVTTAAQDGEYMVRMIWGDDGGPWGFSLQTLDPQRCPIQMREDRPSGGGFIRHGIHFNQYGRPIAYYFTTLDEGDADYWYGGKGYIRVPAEEIIHGFEEDSVGQKRGLPWMATSLYRMRHLNGMEDAAVVNARIGAAKMGFIQWKDGFGPEVDDDDEDSGVPEISGEAGEWTTLPEGAEIKEWNPQYPSGEFAPFTKYILRGIASGMGVPYNELAADLEGVNFSSIRQGTLDSREHWKDRQQWLIDGLMQRVFDAWLPRAVLSGRIKIRGKAVNAANLAKYSTVEWQARRWQWIDPRADVDAAVESKNNMLASPSTIIREQGKDPLAVWQETARDVKSMIDALVAEGLDEKSAKELVLLSFGRQPEKPQPQAAQGIQNANAA